MACWWILMMMMKIEDGDNGSNEADWADERIGGVGTVCSYNWGRKMEEVKVGEK